MSLKRTTIKEVAKEARVSIATVSRCLANPTSVKKQSRERILHAVKKLHYRPQLYARKLAGGRLNTLGLIIPGYEGIFYSFYALEIIRCIARTLEDKEYDLHLHIFWEKDRFRTSLVEGVIFADIIGNERQLVRVLKEGLPCVVINRKVTEHNVSWVAVDNFKGAYEAVDFLVHQGHKRIAHIAGDLRVQCAQERLDGYRAALQRNRLPIERKYTKIADFSPLKAKQVAEELLSQPRAPTAIFCASDEMAFEVLNVAQERKICVPDELSIIGFDDNPQCLYKSVSLTTVRQPLGRVASLGVEILENLVKGRQQGVRKEAVLPELVIRDSAGHI